MGKDLLDNNKKSTDLEKTDDNRRPEEISKFYIQPKYHSPGFVNNAFTRKKTEVNDHFCELSDHFTYDDTDKTTMSNVENEKAKFNNSGKRKFSGAMTLLNPEGNVTKEKIMKYGLESYDKEYLNSKTDIIGEAPISPLRPFTAMNPEIAHKAILTSYNRTKIPVADVEFRKGFRHIFINRPECYIMSIDGGLSEQAENDPDFSSSFSRMPHISKLLSPIYVSGSFSMNALQSNWNYLLSNRILTMNSGVKTSIGVVDSIMKSVEGHTVTPGRTIESTQGNTLTITFRDTKTLEVYEFLRMWMLYIHKIKKGIFAPSYNGYRKHNNFLQVGEKMLVSDTAGAGCIYHPYDRALDYTASIFDIITNETMSKIINWQKYYGVYPVDVSVNGLDGESGSALVSEVTVSATFRYQRKMTNNNKTLVEFNFNAGITDNLGRVRDIKFTEIGKFYEVNKKGENAGLPSYLGESDMFVGTPFIVLGIKRKDPVTKEENIMEPYLKFSGIDDVEICGTANASLVNHHISETADIIGTI